MSRAVESRKFSDTEFSCGDKNRNVSKQKQKEENNNEINTLSKELSMGCVIDTLKKPNVCVESYVEKDIIGDHHDEINDDDAYSEDFEDINEGDDEIETGGPDGERINGDEGPQLQNDISKCSLAASSAGKTNASKTKSAKRRIRSAKSRQGSAMPVKGMSLSSISIPPNMRKNMSFTNERLREIERQNHILLKKILNARNKQQSSIPKLPEKKTFPKMVPPAAVSRRQQQSRIDRENTILLKKIQRAKSSVCSLRR